MTTLEAISAGPYRIRDGTAQECQTLVVIDRHDRTILVPVQGCASRVDRHVVRYDEAVHCREDPRVIELDHVPGRVDHRERADQRAGRLGSIAAGGRLAAGGSRMDDLLGVSAATG